MLHEKDHYDLMAAFERCHSGRLDKEDKAFWPKGVIYHAFAHENTSNWRQDWLCDALSRTNALQGEQP